MEVDNYLACFSELLLVSDVKDLQNRHTELVAAAMSTNKMVKLNCKNIVRLNNNLGQLHKPTSNFLINEAFTRLHEQYGFHKVSLLLSALETCYLYYAF